MFCSLEPEKFAGFMLICTCTYFKEAPQTLTMKGKNLKQKKKNAFVVGSWPKVAAKKDGPADRSAGQPGLASHHHDPFI